MKALKKTLIIFKNGSIISNNIASNLSKHIIFLKKNYPIFLFFSNINKNINLKKLKLLY